MKNVHRYGRFEIAVDLDISAGTDVLREVEVEGTFTSPSGQRFSVPGFWDGGHTWRVRFSPDDVGEWRYTVAVTIAGRARATESSGRLACAPYEGDNPLYRHGPIRLAAAGPYLEHDDGTPFFWLGDTVWNGPMLSTAQDWDRYLKTRRGQGFTGAQFVSTSWRTAPDGGPAGPAYTRDAVDGPLRSLNPGFFQHLDSRFAANADAGLVSAPVLLWAIGGGENAEANPGFSLSEDDCVLLARYQIARWHAFPTLWILNGDGRYTGETAARWRRIGRRVFAERMRASGESARTSSTSSGSDSHSGDSSTTHGHAAAVAAPVAVHPGGRLWVGDEFATEAWLDVVGYQSGHGDDETAWRWLAEGPPATEWRHIPGKAVINLEPCYEYHLGYHFRQPHSPENVRRACYWSLLVSPTAGVTYGGHGVWGWDDGSGPPAAHPNTGTPLPWQQALHMPGAQQMRHLHDLFTGIPWWTLRPDQTLLREQPGEHDVLRFVAAARSDDGTLAVLYLPTGGPVALDISHLVAGLRAAWHNPRDGSQHDGGAVPSGAVTLTAPDDADWLLVLSASGQRPRV